MKKMSEFTFGILTYNQETLVPETLESILYQVQTYGKDIRCRCIVVDDCSKDGTVQTVRGWMEQNADVFCETQLITNTQNRGTVCSYNRLLGMIGDENFKILAGDDLISSGNLFEKYQGLDDRSLYTFLRIELTDGKLGYDENALAVYYFNQTRQRHHLSRMRRGGYLHTPSTLYNKMLYNEAQCERLNREFRLFEDDPTWYSMIKNIPGLRIHFSSEPVVLYRIHQQSVSNAKRTQKSEFDMEMEQLHRIYQKDAGGAERLYWFFRNREILPKYLNPARYADYIIRKMKVMCVSHSRDYRQWKQAVDACVQREQLYYKEIQKRLSAGDGSCSCP